MWLDTETCGSGLSVKPTWRLRTHKPQEIASMHPFGGTEIEGVGTARPYSNGPPKATRVSRVLEGHFEPVREEPRSRIPARCGGDFLPLLGPKSKVPAADLNEYPMDGRSCEEKAIHGKSTWQLTGRPHRAPGPNTDASLPGNSWRGDRRRGVFGSALNEWTLVCP